VTGPAGHRPRPSNNPGYQRVRAWVSWSTGKESAYALHVARRDRRVDVAGLFTTVDEDTGTVAYTGVPVRLAQAQAEALALPLHMLSIPARCSPGRREELRRAVLTGTAVPAGVRMIIFGDVAADVRASRAARLAGLGIDAAFPLWGMDTRHLARLILDAGIKAVITRVDPSAVAVSWLGKCFGTDFIAALPEAADPCGEQGEFHTFTCDGPGFAHAIPVVLEGARWHDGTARGDLSEANVPAHCGREPA
jgi:uncharacterized protein (TIGR00290 family)